MTDYNVTGYLLNCFLVCGIVAFLTGIIAGYEIIKENRRLKKARPKGYHFKGK